MSDLVLKSLAEGICTLTLNNPKSLNALSEEVMDALSHHLDQIAQDRTIKAVILRSSSDHFCAGHNLKEMSARRSDPDGGFQYFRICLPNARP